MSATLELVRLRPTEVTSLEELVNAMIAAGEQTELTHPGPVIAELKWSELTIIGSAYHDTAIKRRIIVKNGCYLPKGYEELTRLAQELAWAKPFKPFVVRYELQNRDLRDIPVAEYRQIIWEKCEPWK